MRTYLPDCIVAFLPDHHVTTSLLRQFCVVSFGGMAGMVLTGCKPQKTMQNPMTSSMAGEERYFNIGHGVELEFRWIPAGKFIMGSPPNEVGRNSDENQTPVIIKDGFWIAATETTVATWHKVMEPQRSAPATSGRKPVNYVSWFDCKEFLQHLKSPAQGWRFDLPTQAQWEYACRAGSRGAYALPPDKMAWLDVNSGGHRHPVGVKSPNAWMVCDMQGNVAEWCLDSVGPGGTERAIRGGSWNSDFNSRAAARNSDTPFLRINRVGFRVVLVRDNLKESQTLPPVCKVTTPRHQ